MRAILGARRREFLPLSSANLRGRGYRIAKAEFIHTTRGSTGRRIRYREVEAAHEACRGSAAARDADAYFYANERFHYAIYAASHNTFLFEQAAALQRKLRPYRRLQLRVRNRPQRSFEEHQAIVDALHEGNAEKAVQAIRAHVVVQGERFADLIASLSQMAAAGLSPDAPADPAARA